MKRRAVIMLALMVIAAVPSVAPAVEPETKTGDAGAAELLLVQLRLNGVLLPDYEDALAEADGGLWLPLEPLVRTGEGSVETVAAGAYRFELGLALPEVDIEMNRQRLRVGGREQPWPDEGFALETGRLLVSKDLLELWYGFEIALSDDRLTVDVDSQRPLPGDLRRLRERRWQRFNQKDYRTDSAYVSLESPYTAWGTPRGDLRGSLGHNNRDDSPRGSLSGAFEAEAAYLSNRIFFSADDQNNLNSLRWSAGRQSPDGDVFGIPNLHRLRFGDVSGFRLPLQGGRSGRGVSFSTAPLKRPDLFDVMVVEGDALSGWDAELYSGGQLIDFQTIEENGRYRFADVPLGFGRNELKVVLYGPEGQIQERILRRDIASGQLLPGELQVRGSILDAGRVMFPLGRESSDSGKQINLRADYGLSRWLSTGAFIGVEPQPQRLAEEELTITNTGVSLQPVFGAALSELIIVTQDTGGNAFQGSLQVPVAGLNVSTRLAQYSDEYRSPGALQSGRAVDSRFELRTGFGLGRLGSVTAEYDRLGLDAAAVRHELSPTLRHRMRGVSFSHEVTLSKQDEQRSSRYRLLASQRLGAWNGRAQLRAAGRDLSDLSVSSLNAGIDYRDADGRNYGAGSRYTLSSDQYSLSGRYSQQLGRGQLGFSGSVDQSGNWGMGLTYAIALGIGHAGRRSLTWLNQGAGSGGAAALQIFEDLDNNGLFEPDNDRPMAGAGMQVNGRPTSHVSDENGWLLLPSLPTDRPVRLTLDRDSLMDPFLTTQTPRLLVQPRPGYTLGLPLPLQDSGFLTGTVLRNGRPVAGALVQATRFDGVTVETTFSLSDGYFSFETLAPGEWRLTVAPETLGPGWKTSEVALLVESGQSHDGLTIELTVTEPALP
ncbi:carboxypeptidase regulatory-like domain-containing protein [Spiribacter roseus]|uniref:Carboxypeptidase regulatory-like domain-containing protein n=1 Tax=Spiribacter roseus TaxID=1855875 RepID=A0ABV3RZP6_9GAMM